MLAADGSQVWPPLAFALSPRKLLHPKLWGLLGGSSLQWLVSARKQSPVSLLKFSTSLKRHPSFHISPWDLPMLQLHHSSDSCSTQSCFPQPLTVLLPKQLSDNPPAHHSPSQNLLPRKTDLHQLVSFLEFIFCIMSVYILSLFFFFCNHECLRYLHILHINPTLVLFIYLNLFANCSWHTIVY